MTDNLEKRQEYRLQDQEIVFLEVVSADLHGKAASNILISKSVDISANGLQLTIDRDLPLNSIHNICVQLDNPDITARLIGEVKWSKKMEPGNEYRIGFSLFESDQTDMQEWKELVAKRCEY